MSHVTKSKPNLLEVVRKLRACGHVATALDLVRAVGIQEVLVPTVAKTPKPKYIREKARSAYIHVVADVDPEQQQRILNDFRTLATCSEPWLSKVGDDSLMKIALPGKVVVYAFRVPLEKYSASSIPAMLSKSQLLEAYTRKPRSDAQHHVTKQEN
jgi:hypothetical protein